MHAHHHNALTLSWSKESKYSFWGLKGEGKIPALLKDSSSYLRCGGGDRIIRCHTHDHFRFGPKGCEKIGYRLEMTNWNISCDCRRPPHTF